MISIVSNQKKGENIFRKIEEKIVLNSLEYSNNIIAIGGGAFLNEKIRNQVDNKFIRDWMDAQKKFLIKNNFKVLWIIHY